MFRQHNQRNEHKLEQTPGDKEGQGNVLQSMGSQRAGQDLATEQQQQQNTQFILWKHELLLITLPGIFVYVIFLTVLLLSLPVPCFLDFEHF